MPRRLLGIFILLLVLVSSMQAQGDAVLFTVGPESVSKAEFEYRLGRSSNKDGRVLLRTWARFKQKVQWARELGLDTLSVYRHQKEHYQRIWAKNKRLIGGEERSPGKQEWIRLRHVTFSLPQCSSKKQEREGWKQLDSLYAVWEKGEELSFEVLPWIQTRHLLNEWQYQLAKLDKGEYSRPFMSPLGIHIIAWTDRRMENQLATSYSEADATYRLKEMEESLLLVHLDDYLEKTLNLTEADLETYFDSHREEYGWGTPHYRGAVIHCQSKKVAKKIKKHLKKYPEALWKEAWKQLPTEISGESLMEMGLFPIGSNPYVDKLAFKCGKYEPLKDYPYTWVMGKILKKGPSDYTDVREKMEKDCREAQKEAEMEASIQKYRVEINEEVLKTVNHDGNK